MGYSESQNKATQKYIKNNYDTITLRVPRGKREAYNEQAKAQGLSLTALIVKLLEEQRKEQ